jgi:hypothetical protein
MTEFRLRALTTKNRKFQYRHELGTEIPASNGEKVITLDRAQFAKVRDQWLRPSNDSTELQLMREKAGRKRDVREHRYRPGSQERGRCR